MPGDEAVPSPTHFGCLFAIVRMDEWVLKVSIAIPVLCVAGLILWHLVGYLAGKLFTKPKPYRHALEPRPPLPREADHGPIERPDAVARAVQSLEQLVAQAENDPEQLQRVRAALEDALAKIHLALAQRRHDNSIDERNGSNHE